MSKLSTAASGCWLWLSLAAFALILAGRVRVCNGDVPPNPNPYSIVQPDGTETGSVLYLRGSLWDNWEEDAAGHTVIRDDAGFEVYAVRDSLSGLLVSSHCVVGSCDPDKIGIRVHEQPIRQEAMDLLHDSGILDDDASDEKGNYHYRPSSARPLRPQLLWTEDNRNSASLDVRHQRRPHQERHRRKLRQGVMKNMVVMIRFSDHIDRPLPTPQKMDVLFNTVDCDQNNQHSDICPTGSVRDCFLFNSYGKLDIQSEIFGWFDMPNTEAYYSGGYAGVTGHLQDGIKWALGRVQAQLNAQGRGFRDFDTDGDGWIDAISIINSGYDASYGGQDCYNPEAEKLNRIWAHYFNLGTWTSSDYVKVDDYHISSALWANCGSEIARIGVICHETGHFLGFHDLYDGGGGSGLGSWGLMSNSWGFDGTQRFPPMVNPWHKKRLGWMEPFYITEDGIYEISASHSDPLVYVISSGYHDKEYLLIENRQRYHKFEANIPRGGLFIWHIDEKANISIEGYPGQAGWPENGKHYAIAIMAPDGNYDLEQGRNTGDKGDMFHSGGMDEIGPEGVRRRGKLKRKYPNTDAYQYGRILRTGHRIFNISSSGDVMTFNYCKGCNATTKKQWKRQKRKEVCQKNGAAKKKLCKRKGN